MRRSLRVAVPLLLLCLAAAWMFLGSEASPVTQPAASTEPHIDVEREVASSGPPAVVRPRPVVPSPPSLGATVADDTPRTTLPVPGTRARHRTWVHASYGPGERQLGFAKFDNEMTPPHGFVVTPDGKLLVLDTIKQRLVWYSAEGDFERAAPLPEGALVFPADVAVADDGTIVVVDHAGVQTKGIVMLDPQGNKVRELPQIQDGLMTGFYTVGNDVYAEVEALHSRKLGETNGSASDETPNAYQQEDGSIPGFVAPDGRSMISFDVTDNDAGAFSITLTRGAEPEHLFTRFYTLGGKLGGIGYAQLDAEGRIYVVLYLEQAEALLCLDGHTGDPVGLAPMPSITNSEGGTQFRRYRVVPTGGLVATINTMQGVSYEWFNCF